MKKFAILFSSILILLIISSSIFASTMIEKESSDAEALSEEFLDEYFLDADLTPERLAQLTLDEKRELYQSSERIDIDENEVDAFLLQCDFPRGILDKMELGVKATIYESIKTNRYNGFTVEFIGFDDTIVSFPDLDSDLESQMDPNQIQPYARIPEKDLELSITSTFINGNNMNRYLLYPSFHWLSATGLKNDAFGYALNSNYWKGMSNGSSGTLTIYINHKLSSTILPNEGFECNWYEFAGAGVNLPYYGIAEYGARPRTKEMDNRIAIGYAQTQNASCGFSVSGLNLSFPGATNQRSNVLNFDRGY